MGAWVGNESEGEGELEATWDVFHSSHGKLFAKDLGSFTVPFWIYVDCFQCLLASLEQRCVA
jgi:hypothetical protein